MKQELIKKVACAFEMCGSTLSEGAMEMTLVALEQYNEVALSKALDKCAKEITGRLSLAAIIQRIDDGRPGVEAAWGMVPKSEHESVVWTTEMREAYGACCGLLDARDTVGARMAFKEKYSALLSSVRANESNVKWVFSAGQDVSSREGVLLKAVQERKILPERAQKMMPELESSEQFKQLMGDNSDAEKQLAGIVPDMGSVL